MATKGSPDDHFDSQHQTPLWQTRMTIIPETMGFLISCDMRLMPLEEFLHLVKLINQAAVDYLKEEGIIIDTRMPPLQLVKS